MLNLGNRMKEYEKQFSLKLDSNLPIIVRIDGKTFHTFTRKMQKPFDNLLSAAMQETTRFLCETFNCDLGYTQSDEISLLWLTPNKLIFDGKMAKYNSVLASYTTAFFNAYSNWHKLAFFDCRVFNLPDFAETKNYFIWRERDAIKNSITLAASSYYSHKELLNKDSQDKLEMLQDKQVNFYSDYPKWFIRGSYFKRVNEEFENQYGKFNRNPYKMFYDFPFLTFDNFEENLMVQSY
jgi:tRNA(His) 5'-end guanylyltransferase